MFPVLPIIFALRLLTNNGQRGSSGPPMVAQGGRSVLWACSAVGFFGWGIASLIALGQVSTGALALQAVGYMSVLFVWGAGLFFAFPLLRLLARRGYAKTVYYLAHFALIFPRTGETYGGAALLAALAYAHRGNVSEEEIEWVRVRLAKQAQPLGTFAAGYALLEALEAKAAFDAGRSQEAIDRRERARTLFGTVTYMSKAALPTPVRRLVHEILALASARDGEWPMLIDPGTRFPARAHRVLRAWVRERLMKEEPSWLDRRARRAIASEEIEALHARKAAEQIESAEEARIVAGDTYITLMKGGSVSPGAALQMLTVLDMFVHPSFEGCLAPEPYRQDPAFMDQIATEIATAIAGPLSRRGVPIFMLDRVGPVSARVHAILETAFLNELSRVLAGLEETLERAKGGFFSSPPLDEWFMASYVRSLFRRVEGTLGEPAAARVFARYLYIYTKLGVALSETWPRMRPLAHAIFNCLHADAVRFGDKNAALMANNKTITRGIA